MKAAMQWSKKLFKQRCTSNGVYVDGEEWNPAPFGSRLRGQDATHPIEQMTGEQLARVEIKVSPHEQAAVDALVDAGAPLRAMQGIRN